MTDDEIIAVVTAHKEGKRIQWRHCVGDGKPSDWYTPGKGHHPHWDFAFYEYRVAPEPRKLREWSVVLNREGDIIAVAVYREGHEIIRVREVIE